MGTFEKTAQFFSFAQTFTVYWPFLLQCIVRLVPTLEPSLTVNSRTEECFFIYQVRNK